MRNFILFLFLSLILIGCQGHPVTEDGGYSWDLIFIKESDKFVRAHGYIAECSSQESFMSFEILSYMGISKVEIIGGSEYISVLDAPSYPPLESELYESTHNGFDKYLQELSLRLFANQSAFARNIVVRVWSDAYDGLVSDITIRQAGR